MSAAHGYRPRPSRTDAIALLRADHRQVERWFREFESASSECEQRELGQRISKALRIHTLIEEEIFYPVFLEMTGDEAFHHEAVIEHAGAKKLIEEIEQSAPGDTYYAARIHVLSEMIRHHVKEEEKPLGMFAAARRANIDLEVLGRRLRSRKEQLNSERDGQWKFHAA